MPGTPGIFLVPRDAANLDAARAGRTYSSVASSAGCSASFLCDLCHGVSRRVTASLAGRIEDALGVPRGSLFMLEPADAELLMPYWEVPIAS
jgi:hypothetical protein